MGTSKEKIVVPTVLKAYESELIEAQREYISIEAKPLDCKLACDSLAIKQSKFLGFPFFPSDLDKKWGRRS